MFPVRRVSVALAALFSLPLARANLPSPPEPAVVATEPAAPVTPAASTAPAASAAGAASTAGAATTAPPAATAQPTLVIPEPPELAQDVRFWVRVYSEISTNEGFIHDERNLAVVYEKLRFEAAVTPREREQKVDAERERWHDMLRRLALGGEPQSEEERRARALWGGADNARLLQAADEVRFQLGQSDRFRSGLERAGRWQRHIAGQLSRLGLPAELAALPHVESSFNPEAYSKVGAAGLWQFMRSTGRLYMRIDSSVDERLDPFRATEAAAQLLSYNYRALGNWPLAITAYNHGSAGMRRAVAQVGSDDIVRIVREYRSPSFGFASRNFFVSFLAALTISRAPDKYFGALRRESENSFRELLLTQAANMAAVEKSVGLERDTLRALNPALRPAVWSGQRLAPRGYRLRLPNSVNLTASRLLAQLTAPPGAAPASTVTASAASTPPVVASVAAVTAPAIVNPPAVIAAPVLATVDYSPTGAERAPADYYVVHRGDTLSSVAVSTSVRTAELMRLNGLRDSDFVYEGQRLRLHAEASVPREQASAQTAAEQEAISDSRRDMRMLANAARTRPSAPVTAAEEQAESPTLVPGAGAAAAADAIDYSVAANGSIVIAAAETLGHYADWLHISAARLRALNGYSSRTPVAIGRRLKLDFARASREEFEQRRREYHDHLQAEYFASNQLAGTRAYVIRRGDSLWTVTQREQVPVWLLQQYNPDVNFSDLRPGAQLVIPAVVTRG